MATFKKREPVIEAAKFDGTPASVEAIRTLVGRDVRDMESRGRRILSLISAGGRAAVPVDHYVVRVGPDEFISVSATEFEQKYEQVNGA